MPKQEVVEENPLEGVKRISYNITVNVLPPIDDVEGKKARVKENTAFNEPLRPASPWLKRHRARIKAKRAKEGD
jgi:hypothetical protein